jgi:Bacterial Ig domain
MKVTGILLSAFSAVLLSGCSKGGSIADSDQHIIDNNDLVAPVISITTPGEGQVFNTGNTITVSGKVTDAGGLYRGSIRITNDANGSLVKEQLYEIHGMQLYNFNITHLTAVTTLSDYTVTVRFEDHGLNVTTASVKVKVNP